MKKPVNKFAVALWIVAALVFVCETAYSMQTYSTLRGLNPLQGGTTYFFIFASYWRIVQGTLTSSVVIAAFGYMIELLDRIHWTLQHRSNETA